MILTNTYDMNTCKERNTCSSCKSLTNKIWTKLNFKRAMWEILKSQKRPTRKVFVYKIKVNLIHTILKYGDYYDFMDR